MSRATPIPRLHVLTDATIGLDDLRIVDAALAGGAPVIQVRVKDRTTRAHLEVVRAIVARCRAAGVSSIVNDRVDIALSAGADGVHLGLDDLPIADARALAGERLFIGGTARDPDTARALVAAGADYLGVGPTFATRTKDGLPDPLGPAGVAAVVDAVEVPVIAIAGIDASRVPAVLATGAHGIAVTAAVTAAEDPAAAVRELLGLLAGGVGADGRGADGGRTPDESRQP
jgi:thiamine-phosphate pyrophosphorylase